MFRVTSYKNSRGLAILLGLAALLPAGRAAHSQIAVLSSTVEEHTGAPGESYLGRIQIANSSRRAQVVRLYMNDYRFFADGTSDFAAPGSTSRSNAPWISLQSQQVTVPAGGEVNVPYTVAIPKLDSLRGSYWGAIMVEPATHGPTGSGTDSASKARVGLGMIIRYAVQVSTHIGASGTRSVHFDKIEAKQGVDSAAGRMALELDVENGGERAYRPALWTEIYDAQGTLRAKSKQQRGLLYPGCSLRQRFDLGKLPHGTYKAVIFADTGEESVYASQYTVVF